MTGHNGNGTREKLLTQKQVAARCQVSETTVGVWLSRKLLRYVQLPSGRRRVRERDVDEFLETVIGR